MPLLIWQEDFSVDVKEIDEQHKKWVGFINRLYDAMMEKKANNILGDLLNDFLDYSGTHFKTEENYFDQFGYAEAAEHKEAHAAFTRKVLGYKQEVKDKNVFISIEVLNFIKEWLVKHICHTDRKYAECFHEHGLR